MQTTPVAGCGTEDLETYKQIFIDGVEYPYEVSDIGNVRRVGSDKCLKPGKDSNRLHVNLCKSGKYKSMKIHRLVAQAFIPNPDNKPEVDHVDCNPMNNKVENLRWCNRAENQANRLTPKCNTCGLKGVSYSKSNKKYFAQIKKLGKHTFLGYFNTAEEAHETYKKKALELFGQFARFK